LRPPKRETKKLYISNVVVEFDLAFETAVPAFRKILDVLNPPLREYARVKVDASLFRLAFNCDPQELPPNTVRTDFIIDGAADKRCLGGPSTSPVSNGARNPAASQSVVGFFFGRTLAICHSPVIRHSERFAANLSSVNSCPGRPVRGFFFRPNCAALA
jgi:hypothetical protein